MPRFFFHLRSHNGWEQDDTGLDLDGVESAYLEAYAAVPAISADLLREKANPYRHTFEIMDASGNLLLEVPFSEVLEEGKQPSPPDQRRRWHKAQAEMERTACLIADVQAEQAALQATLADTRRLLAEARKASGRF
ncbi:DUF6894 family protein [Methylobacterium sp. R2-1]|uniref:DUF6894 family protein n=1 Tax=Methylobacterium sp. R2-1 TaxID=2587064 RepID=UPI001620AE24|nr:hypothetical protein [Methylobacterium sp. R2-1]MBB2960948.1 hypothetical protein [Methylobacterium sp. R2-1]